MDASRLTIGAYYLAPYASTEKHVHDLARCGINVVVNMRNDRAALDLLAQNGVGAIVSGIVPGWFGNDGSNAGTMSEKNPLEKYKFAAQAFDDHPAIIGIDAGDEPSSLDFDHYGQVIDLIERRFPGKLAYLNLYPSYALKGSNTQEEIARQLGTQNYGEYIERYVRAVKTPYICFDYYLYSADLPGLYESLATVSRACRKHNRAMWTVLQVNSHQPDVFISENQLHFQANCALSFGAQTIIWACYCAGWWHNHVLDRQGNKTEQYNKLCSVNAHLHRMGNIYMKYRHEETHFVGGFTPQEIHRTGNKAVSALNTEKFKYLNAGNEKLLIGRMTSHEGNSEALFITAADDPSGEHIQTHQVTFACEANRVIAMNGEKEMLLDRDENGIYRLPISSCRGVLVRAEE